MAKLSKAENAQHNKILDLVNSDKILTYDEKIFIYENYNESANVNIREYAAFHTPLNLAWDFSIDACDSENVVELCAGIGILAFCVYHRTKSNRQHLKSFNPYYLCVELVPEYVALGKRLLPEAEWVCADALTYDVLKHQNNRHKFETLISNPPFANIKTSKDYKPRIYKGADFEFKLIERGREIAHTATIILPSQSSPFKYSGSRYYEELPYSKAAKFCNLTDIAIHAGCGVDTSIYKDAWKNTKILCEVVEIDYNYDRKNNMDRTRSDKKLRYLKDTDETFESLPRSCVDFVFTELDFDSVSKRYKDLERVVGSKSNILYCRSFKSLTKENLIATLEMFTSENEVIMHYGVYDTLFAKICLKLKRKYVGVADDFYDKLKPDFKLLKAKYDPKPVEVKDKKSKKDKGSKNDKRDRESTRKIKKSKK